MRARAVKTAGIGESNGKGLRGPAMNALAEVHSRGIMARERPAPPSIGQEKSLQRRLPGRDGGVAERVDHEARRRGREERDEPINATDEDPVHAIREGTSGRGVDIALEAIH